MQCHEYACDVLSIYGLIIIIIIMTFIPRILASASNAPKQSHCQTGKSLAVYKKAAKESVERKLAGRLFQTVGPHTAKLLSQ